MVPLTFLQILQTNAHPEHQQLEQLRLRARQLGLYLGPQLLLLLKVGFKLNPYQLPIQKQPAPAKPLVV